MLVVTTCTGSFVRALRAERSVKILLHVPVEGATHAVFIAEVDGQSLSLSFRIASGTLTPI